MKRLLLLAGITAFGNAGAEELTIPNTFSAGSAAVADEVNANFSAVEVSVDDNAADIEALQAARSSIESDVTANTADIDSLGTTVSGMEQQVNANSSNVDYVATLVLGLSAQQAGIDWSSTDNSSRISTSASTPTAVSSVTVSAPGPGYAIVDFSGMLQLSWLGGIEQVNCALKTDRSSPDVATARPEGVDEACVTAET